MTTTLKLAEALTAARAEIRELRTKIAGYERREAAEGFLIEALDSQELPPSLRPSSVPDFLEKRAMVEKHDLKATKLAAQMLAQGYEIGGPEKIDAPTVPYNDSRADAEFEAWLAGSQGG